VLLSITVYLVFLKFFCKFYFLVVKTTILLVDMNAFPVVNEAYKQFFDEKKGYPARSCYQVFF